MKSFVAFLTILFFFTLSFSKNNIPETPFSEYNFPATECKVIHHQQSRIFIPSYTFYLDDKLYEGQVNLKYLEFTDQLDILLNHIPMTYAENDRSHVLESGGMFELYAYGNGKQLSFAPHKKISVQLATKFDITGGETFVLDRKANQWKKKTMFGDSKESNEILSDNKNELWGDNTWKDPDSWQDGDMQKYDSAYVIDPNTGIVTLTVASSLASRNRAFKTINIDKMDLYNCDRILNETTVPMVADFKLEGYSQNVNSEIFVVYKKRNAVLSYFPEQFATSFKLLPDEDFTIFTYSKDGKIAVLDKQFAASFNAAANSNKKVVFPMKVYPNLPSTKKELAEITGL